jgi:hypothetical protein
MTGELKIDEEARDRTLLSSYVHTIGAMKRFLKSNGKQQR